MKIHFKISYFTHWGQRLLITGNIPQLGNGDFKKALSLNFENTEDWVGKINVDDNTLTEFAYKYILLNENNGQIIEEWGENRICKLNFSAKVSVYNFDSWNSSSAIENTFLSAPFRNVLLPDEHELSSTKKASKFTHVFTVSAPTILRNMVVCLVGDNDKTGNWTVNDPLLLSKVDNDKWETRLNLSKQTNELHYKYGIFDSETGKFCFFESGTDRVAPVLNSPDEVVNMNDGFVRIQHPDWRGTGVGIPVFGLRSNNSFGVGDFADIMLLVDWAKKTGIKLIQVLPLNDTIGTHTEEDVLPYAAISAFALNPLFLNLPALGILPPDNPILLEYQEIQPRINASDLVPFLDVVNFKIKYSREVFKQQKTQFLNSPDFKVFFEKNEYWLVPYAAYCVLRDLNNTPDYRMWKEFSKYETSKIHTFVSESEPHFDDIALNYFIQYHLHVQLLSATNYAHKNGIVLKGDIPIGVNRNSVDTWVAPELFNMNCNAGAPPDMFAIKGQNWELPTYNWEMIKQTGYDWWKKRFSQLSNYFDTFRIDHILGFFRIWQIPENQIEGIMGHLYPSTPVHINEFNEKGIWFDYNRFCKPYITDAILWELFGDDASWVKTNCLKIEDGWVLRLKTPYDSQTGVEKLFLQGKISEKVKWGLFDLISNILLFEVAGSNGTQFYPRFGMQSLQTYKELDQFTQHKLNELYVDYFFRRQDANWYQSGMEKLPALKRATNMLICGEDLGMMTSCVTSVMNELSILSLEVQRAPKSDKIEFFHPANAPYLSVVTPSTHDMSTIRGWWEEDRAVTQRFYNSQLGHWGKAPFYCEWWICRDILLQHLYSPAMWAIFQLQDLMSISEKLRRQNPHDERINVPSNSKNSWRYRMHLSLEELIENDEFNSELRNYILQSGR